MLNTIWTIFITEDSPCLCLYIRYSRTRKKKVKPVLQHCCQTSFRTNCAFSYLRIKPGLLQDAKICWREERYSLLSLTKSVHVVRFNGTRLTCFAATWRTSGVWWDLCAILSHQNSVFKQLTTTWFIAKQVWTRVVIHTTPLSSSFSNHVAK